MADLFNGPRDDFDEASVRAFVLAEIEARAQAESTVVEFKSQVHTARIAEAVAAFSNTDGGLLFIGVDPLEADPLVGVRSSDIDRVSQALHGALPHAVPEMIPVSLAGGVRAVVVVRVDADSVDHPVVLHGKVWVRIPGHTVGASRDQVLALVARASQGAVMQAASFDAARVDVMRTPFGSDEPWVECRTGVRVTGPPSAAAVRWLGTSTLDSVEDALFDTGVPWNVRRFGRSPFGANGRWSVVESTTSRCRFKASESPGDPSARRPQFEAALSLAWMSPRTLEVFASVRAVAPAEREADLLPDVTDLWELMESSLRSSVAAVSACLEGLRLRAVGSALVAGHITGSNGLASLQVRRGWVRHDGLPRWNDDHVYVPTVSVSDFGAEEIDGLLRSWITTVLYDAGLTDFESDVSRLGGAAPGSERP